jgi:hypothetical protein
LLNSAFTLVALKAKIVGLTGGIIGSEQHMLIYTASRAVENVMAVDAVSCLMVF